MKLLSLLTLFCTLTSCASTWNPTPVSAGTSAVLCAPGRAVYCQEGDERCQFVAAAVKQINEVVPGLLVYKGTEPHAAIVDRFNDKAQKVIVVVPGPPGAGDMDNAPIAFTALNPDWDTACLPSTPIVLVYAVHNKFFDFADWQEIVLHEILHALGCEHAEQRSPFSSVMRPAPLMEKRSTLSKADKNWLRTVYGQAY